MPEIPREVVVEISENLSHLNRGLSSLAQRTPHGPTKALAIQLLAYVLAARIMLESGTIIVPPPIGPPVDPTDPPVDPTRVGHTPPTDPRMPPPADPVDPTVSAGDDWTDAQQSKPVTTSAVHTHWGVNVINKYGQSPVLLGIDFAAQGTINKGPNGQGGACLMTDVGVLQQGVIFDSCMIRGAIAPDGFPHILWGMRAYDCVGWKFSKCYIGDVRGEHGLYLSAPGTLVLEDCLIENCGSQGLQVTYRTRAPYEHETSDPELQNIGGIHMLKRTTVRNCGQPSDGTGPLLDGTRPAYALSFFEAQTPPGVSGRLPVPVVLLACLVSSNQPDFQVSGNTYNSYGAIMVHDRPGTQIVNTRVDYRNPSNDVVQIWNVDDVLIEGSSIEEGIVEIRNAKTVTVMGNAGGATLRVGNGPTSGSKIWPLSDHGIVIHEGPISEDFTL